MKSVFCKIVKLPDDGDELRVCYKHRIRGGMSEASIKIGPRHFWRQVVNGEDLTEKEVQVVQPDLNEPAVTYVKLTNDEAKNNIASALADAVNRQWVGEMFSCRSRNDEIIITTNEDDHLFFPLLNGTEKAGRDVLSIE